MSDAKPCPFCGEMPVVVQASNDTRWWIVQCGSEECDVLPVAEAQGRAEVLAKWNKRTAPVTPDDLTPRFPCSYCTKKFLTMEVRDHHEEGCLIERGAKKACRCPSDFCRLEPDNSPELCPDLRDDEICAYR